MNIPGSLAAWTFDTVLAVVERHEFESGLYDYKEVLNATGAGRDRDDHLASVRRAVCSMANGSGGYILFGVRDRKQPVAAPKDRIVGMPTPIDPRKEFGDKLKTLERDIYFDAAVIPFRGDDTRCFFVVQVPTSVLRPHSVEGTFYIRGEGGSARPMSFFEVRDQMLYTEGRLQKITMLRMELTTLLKALDMLNVPSTWNVRLDLALFKTLLADVSDILPTDSGLLASLHEIGSRATLLNPILDKADQVRFTRPSGLEGQVRAEVMQRSIDDRTELFNMCQTARARLAEVYGPLKTS
jgi:hypothetical protein